jgi:hypothetical protein
MPKALLSIQTRRHYAEANRSGIDILMVHAKQRSKARMAGTMESNLRTRMIDQMPRRQPWTFERYFNVAAGVVTIVSGFLIFFSLDKLSDDIKMIAAMSYLMLIIIFLVIYLLLINRRKLARYAEAAFHLHLVSHVIRDHLAAIEIGEEEAGRLPEKVSQILDTIAACFSLLTGRQCRVALKEITPYLTLKTVQRDCMSATSVQDSHPPVEHKLDKNTAFKNIWYRINNCTRYFHSDDLVAAWRNHTYENTSFEIYGRPEISTFMGHSRVRNWKLPYKSTIVFPIRYIHDWSRRPALAEQSGPASETDEIPHVWGFLCIDARSKRAFRLPYAAEVGGAFADALYVLFTYSLGGMRRQGPGA